MTISMPRTHESSAVTDLLVAAFADDPLMAWLFPDRSGRSAALPVALGSFVTEGVADGDMRTLSVGGALRAAAIWQRLPCHDDPQDPDWSHTPEPLRGSLDRLAALERALAERHPTGPDHWYLRVIGVRPQDHGHGYGGALLQSCLAEADRAGRPCYLEASSSRNAALYARHGFDASDSPIHLPDGLALIPMWREPRSPEPVRRDVP